ncbi:unnamed protein product [Chironomus riparius]|uniref:Uncharacterized protein n=1 Tax=Chironomus riparius TaxID=315576 RepID=A0A9N9S015_9DIPT|nr:unnamed protein product [Chironomus riparius]
MCVSLYKINAEGMHDRVRGRGKSTFMLLHAGQLKIKNSHRVGRTKKCDCGSH